MRYFASTIVFIVSAISAGPQSERVIQYGTVDEPGGYQANMSPAQRRMLEAANRIVISIKDGDIADTHRVYFSRQARPGNEFPAWRKRVLRAGVRAGALVRFYPSQRYFASGGANPPGVVVVRKYVRYERKLVVFDFVFQDGRIIDARIKVDPAVVPREKARPWPEPNSLPWDFKFIMKIQQGKRTVRLSDGIRLRLRNQKFTILFNARDYGPINSSHDAIFISCRLSDLMLAPHIGRRPRDTVSFPYASAVAARSDGALSWIFVSEQAFNYVYHQHAMARRAEYRGVAGPGLMQLSLEIRELYLDRESYLVGHYRKKPPNYPGRMYCAFFMDANKNKIIDAGELVRARIDFESGG